MTNIKALKVKVSITSWNPHTHINTHSHIYIYIYIYISPNLMENSWCDVGWTVKRASTTRAFWLKRTQHRKKGEHRSCTFYLRNVAIGVNASALTALTSYLWTDLDHMCSDSFHELWLISNSILFDFTRCFKKHSPSYVPPMSVG